MIKPNIELNDALKVDQLCGRVLGDIGSIYARITPIGDNGRPVSMPPELVALRRYIREVQDAARDAYPNDFFK